MVTMGVVIGKDGRVKEAYGLRGDFNLQVAARAALMNWTYGTTLLNGQPIEIETAVDIEFKLPN
jgi:hypothetical protein